MTAKQKKYPFNFKTQYGLGFNPQDDEIVVDFFCGGGGAGTGLEMGLGRAVSVAKTTAQQRSACTQSTTRMQSTSLPTCLRVILTLSAVAGP